MNIQMKLNKSKGKEGMRAEKHGRLCSTYRLVRKHSYICPYIYIFINAIHLKNIIYDKQWRKQQWKEAILYAAK